MSYKASDIKGLAIVDSASGKKLEKAKGVVFDLANKKVAAILVKDSGILGEGKAVS